MLEAHGIPGEACWGAAQGTAQSEIEMNRDQFFGGNPLGVIIRLVLLSVVVGVVLSALGITPQNIFYHLDVLVRRIYDMGFGAIEWIVQYFLIGAVIVFPIWFIARLLGMGRRSDDRRP
jgi:hypothetical protein